MLSPIGLPIHDVYDALKRTSAWYLLIRVHDHIWYDRHWPLPVRYEATKQIWNLSIEVERCSAPIYAQRIRKAARRLVPLEVLWNLVQNAAGC